MDHAATLRQGAALLQAGRAADAATVLEPLVREQPRSSESRRLFGLALKAGGQTARAEAELRAAAALDPRSGPTIYALADLLLDEGRGSEALEFLPPADRTADPNLLAVIGGSLKSVGRLGDALDAYAKAAANAPASAVADHNLAGVLGDLERFTQSEAAARRALAKGLAAPETFLVLARALVGQGQLDEAEAAYRQVLVRRPDDAAAHAELGQLIWMRSADPAAATATLDRAIRSNPNSSALRLKKAELLAAIGDHAGAFAAVAPTLEEAGADPTLHIVAARCRLASDLDAGLAHAQAAVKRAPESPAALAVLGEAHLARGEAPAAVDAAERMLRIDPLDQYALGLLATGWRLTSDPRYRRLYDYDAFVGVQTLATPDGWTDLASYLRDLEGALESLHRFRTHPVGQSVRHGSQTSQRLTEVHHPAIDAFFEAASPLIARYIDALGAGDDPMRSRATTRWRFNGEWSIRLAAGGYHACHLHPKGWISSAFYVRLPDSTSRDQQGWLKFGEPGIATSPPLPAERFVEPRPGTLVLFPSYMWHGTTTFTGERDRLTIAFDVVPSEI